MKSGMASRGKLVLRSPVEFDLWFYNDGPNLPFSDGHQPNVAGMSTDSGFNPTGTSPRQSSRHSSAGSAGYIGTAATYVQNYYPPGGSTMNSSSNATQGQTPCCGMNQSRSQGPSQNQNQNQPVPCQGQNDPNMQQPRDPYSQAQGSYSPNHFYQRSRPVSPNQSFAQNAPVYPQRRLSNNEGGNNPLVSGIAPPMNDNINSPLRTELRQGGIRFDPNNMTSSFAPAPASQSTAIRTQDGRNLPNMPQSPNHDFSAPNSTTGANYPNPNYSYDSANNTASNRTINSNFQPSAGPTNNNNSSSYSYNNNPRTSTPNKKSNGQSQLQPSSIGQEDLPSMIATGDASMKTGNNTQSQFRSNRSSLSSSSGSQGSLTIGNLCARGGNEAEVVVKIEECIQELVNLLRVRGIPIQGILTGITNNANLNNPTSASSNNLNAPCLANDLSSTSYPTIYPASTTYTTNNQTSTNFSTNNQTSSSQPTNNPASTTYSVNPGSTYATSNNQTSLSQPTNNPASTTYSVNPGSTFVTSSNPASATYTVNNPMSTPYNTNNPANATYTINNHAASPYIANNLANATYNVSSTRSRPCTPANATYTCNNTASTPFNTNNPANATFTVNNPPSASYNPNNPTNTTYTANNNNNQPSSNPPVACNNASSSVNAGGGVRNNANANNFDTSQVPSGTPGGRGNYLI